MSESIIRPSSDVLFRELDGEAVLLDLGSQRYFGLDEVGTRIWQLLQEHDRREPLLDTLEREYDAPRERLAEDLDLFLDRLREAGLLSEAADGAG